MDRTMLRRAVRQVINDSGYIDISRFESASVVELADDIADAYEEIAMTAELKFITLDDKTHVVGFSEHTACGLVIPIGETLTYDEPKHLCTQCKNLIDGSDEYGVLKSVIEGTAPAEEPVVATKEAKATSADSKAKA